MRLPLSNLPKRPAWHAVLLIALCVVLYFLNLNRWDLWNPDEPRYAQVAREMVNGGDWILMHFNGEIYSDKPPLFFWLIALSTFLWNGFTSFSVRFPSALFGTLTVLLTFLIGKLLYSSRTGFLSALVLATSLEFAYLATRANIDATLTFFTTLSCLCFIQWYWFHKAGGEGEGQFSRLIIFGFYIGMAFATLSKGPVGFILPLLICTVYLLIQRDREGLRRMKLLQGMMLFLLIVLAWYVPALLKGGKEYFNETIMIHTVDRFAKGSSHIRPFYYYLYNFPVDFLPWIFFLPTAIAYGFSNRREGIGREFLFLFVWFAVIFIFFSLSKGKRGLYLLPLFPAVSLMVGKWWEDYISASIKMSSHRWFSIPFHIFLGLLLGLGIGIPWVVWTRFPSYLPYSLPVGLLFVGGSMGLFVLHRLRYRAAIFFLIVGVMACGFFYGLRVAFPLINPYKSARFISQEITSRIQPEEKLAIYGIPVIAPYSYYTGIVPILELEDKEEVKDFLRAEKRVFCLMKFGAYAQIQRMEDIPKMELIVRRKVGGDDVVLVSNVP